MLRDDLFATYLEYCSLGPDLVAVHVSNTYQFHVDTLSAAMHNNNDQPEDDGDGDRAQNQCSNVVLEPVETIQPPLDDRAARRQRRDTQRQGAIAGTHDGNGGNNNGNGNGNGGGGGDDDGNGNGHRNADGPDDGNDPPDPDPAVLATMKIQFLGALANNLILILESHFSGRFKVSTLLIYMVPLTRF